MWICVRPASSSSLPPSTPLPALFHMNEIKSGWRTWPGRTRSALWKMYSFVVLVHSGLRQNCSIILCNISVCEIVSGVVRRWDCNFSPLIFTVPRARSLQTFYHCYYYCVFIFPVRLPNDLKSDKNKTIRWFSPCGWGWGLRLRCRL